MNRMIDFFQSIDQQLFLFFNGFHNPFFDTIMSAISSKSLWIPLYLLFIWLLWKVYNRGFWLPLIIVVFVVAVADASSVHLFKNVFERLRPCHNPQLLELVHTVDGKCGGQYGFVSSHAANMFSIATIMWLFIRKRFHKSYLWLSFWAALVAYSRVYLGVHYPGDILGGAALGMLVGLLGYSLFLALPCKKINCSGKEEYKP